MVPSALLFAHGLVQLKLSWWDTPLGPFILPPISPSLPLLVRGSLTPETWKRSSISPGLEAHPS